MGARSAAHRSSTGLWGWFTADARQRYRGHLDAQLQSGPHWQLSPQGQGVDWPVVVWFRQPHWHSAPGQDGQSHTFEFDDMGISFLVLMSALTCVDNWSFAFNPQCGIV